MAEKKSKSDRDMITEAVLEAANKRIDMMSGAEIKASADRMMEIGKEGGYLSRGPHEPWYSEWNPMPPGTVGHDAYIRGDWSPNSKIDPKAPPEAKIPERAQEYGPWEKGRPFAGGYKEETGPIHPTDKGPWPFHGRTLPGPGYAFFEPGEFDYPPPRPSGHSTPPTDYGWGHRKSKPLDPLSAVDRGYGWIERPEHILGPTPMLPSEKPFPRIAAEERSDAARFEMGQAEEILKGAAGEPKGKKPKERSYAGGITGPENLGVRTTQYSYPSDVIGYKDDNPRFEMPWEVGFDRPPPANEYYYTTDEPAAWWPDDNYNNRLAGSRGAYRQALLRDKWRIQEQEKLAPIDRAPGPPKQRKSKK